MINNTQIYRVLIKRQTYDNTTVFVEACNQDEAKSLALEITDEAWCVWYVTHEEYATPRIEEVTSDEVHSDAVYTSEGEVYYPNK